MSTNRTHVTVEVTETAHGFVGVVRSAKTRRELFTTSLQTDVGRARIFATSATYDRGWNEVA